MPPRPIPWTREEVERLIAWMEDDRERVYTNQRAWHKDVKAEAFADDEHITVERITEKCVEMKKSWKAARNITNQPGWGLRPEDPERSIAQYLERRCAFFERLDDIWGGVPLDRCRLAYVVESVAASKHRRREPPPAATASSRSKEGAQHGPKHRLATRKRERERERDIAKGEEAARKRPRADIGLHRLQRRGIATLEWSYRGSYRGRASLQRREEPPCMQTHRDG